MPTIKQLSINKNNTLTTYDIAVDKANVEGLGAPTTDSPGLVPTLPDDGETTKYLRQDGSWAVPSGGGGGETYTSGDWINIDNSNKINVVKNKVVRTRYIYSMEGQSDDSAPGNFKLMLVITTEIDGQSESETQFLYYEDNTLSYEDDYIAIFGTYNSGTGTQN